jgi:hypothetical protein
MLVILTKDKESTMNLIHQLTQRASRVCLLTALLVPAYVLVQTCSGIEITEAQKLTKKSKKKKSLKKPTKGKTTAKKTKINSDKKTSKRPTKKVKSKPKSLKKVSKPEKRSTRTAINPSKTKAVKSNPKSKTSSKGGLKPVGGKRVLTKPQNTIKGSASKGSKAGKGPSRKTLKSSPTQTIKPTGVKGPSRRVVESTKPGSAKTIKKTTTKTTKTTKSTTATKSVRQSENVSSESGYNEGYQPAPAAAPTYAPAPAPAPRITCRPQGGHMLVNLGFGSQSTKGTDDSRSTYVLGLGYRSDMLGLVGEGQFASYEDSSSLTSLRGQIRLYIPVGECLDLYPLVGLSRFEEDSDQTSAIDLGIGADLNLGGKLSIGARYIRSAFTDSIQNVRNEDVESSNTLLFQVGLYF